MILKPWHFGRALMFWDSPIIRDSLCSLSTQMLLRRRLKCEVNMCKGCIITYEQSGKNDKLYQIVSIMSEGPCESFSYLWTHRPVFVCFAEAVDQAKELAARRTIVMVMSWFALTKFQSKYAPLLGSTHTETMVSSRIVLFFPIKFCNFYHIKE